MRGSRLAAQHTVFAPVRRSLKRWRSIGSQGCGCRSTILTRMTPLTDELRDAFVTAFLKHPDDLGAACAECNITPTRGGQLMRDARTVVLLSRRRQAAAAEADISAARILQRLAAIAFADPRELITPVVDEEGGLQILVGDSSSYSPEAAALYAGAKQTKDGVEIKMHDQMAALKILAAYAGIVTEAGKVELGVSKEVTEIVRTIVHAPGNKDA